MAPTWAFGLWLALAPNQSSESVDNGTRAEPPRLKSLLVESLAWHGLALGSTEWSLRQGSRELNPLLGTPLRRLGVTLGSSLVVAGGLRLMGPKHSRWGRWALRIGKVLEVGWNVRQGLKARQARGRSAR